MKRMLSTTGIPPTLAGSRTRTALLFAAALFLGDVKRARAWPTRTTGAI